MSQTDKTLITTIAALETIFGYSRISKRTYPPKCSGCAERDSFRIDLKKDKASCYEYDDILKDCPRYRKVEDKEKI